MYIVRWSALGDAEEYLIYIIMWNWYFIYWWGDTEWSFLLSSGDIYEYIIHLQDKLIFHILVCWYWMIFIALITWHWRVTYVYCQVILYIMYTSVKTVVYLMLSSGNTEGNRMHIAKWNWYFMYSPGDTEGYAMCSLGDTEEYFYCNLIMIFHVINRWY